MLVLTPGVAVEDGGCVHERDTRFIRKHGVVAFSRQGLERCKKLKHGEWWIIVGWRWPAQDDGFEEM